MIRAHPETGLAPTRLAPSPSGTLRASEAALGRRSVVLVGLRAFAPGTSGVEPADCVDIAALTPFPFY